MMILRTNALDVAFCGGVDLAYTRRDAPPKVYGNAVPQPDYGHPAFQGGDWQSASTVPVFPDDPTKSPLWPPTPAPRAPDVDYSAISNIELSKSRDSDLIESVYGDTQSDETQQVWHDQQ